MEIEVLESLEVKYRAATPIRANLHERRSFAWAAWLVARRGGWDGYPKSRKPGPITMRRGYEIFQSIVAESSLRNVRILWPEGKGTLRSMFCLILWSKKKLAKRFT